ncbi:MAG: heavy-metal-associated domain-containing protein [Betaproteobacteria bacterium]|nr:heavy-metal-associated domain-containing protein [Betaproteobacteria bacterium]
MQTQLLKVTGMTCDGCASNVTNALRAITGVSDVKVSLAAGEATVQFDERLTSPQQLKSAVRHAGYGVDGTPPVHSHHGKGGCRGDDANASTSAVPAAHDHQGKRGCCG